MTASDLEKLKLQAICAVWITCIH